ncbi:hypothetical protein WA026_002004 [Henosepilachna vigintioctopunctata]|uniref:Uncharacterized protein n=1 Tax=Henosepilachna vigintioctopunctata TaxID=420089 RepID=A0AAW1USI7_9CUCU
MMSYVFLLFSSLLAVSCALNLPSYVQPCKKTDPDFVKCALKHGNDAIARITEGDPAYGIPVIDPLKDEEIQHYTYPKLNVTISEIVLYGLKHAKLVSFTKEDTSLSVVVFAKHLKVACKHSLSGQLLEHHLYGSGLTEIEFYNVSIPIHVTAKQSDRKTYLSIENVEAQVLPEKATFKTLHFDGDQDILKLAEKSANENWKGVMIVLSPILDKLLTSAARKTAYAFVNNVPEHLIFQ